MSTLSWSPQARTYFLFHCAELRLSCLAKKKETRETPCDSCLVAYGKSAKRAEWLQEKKEEMRGFGTMRMRMREAWGKGFWDITPEAGPMSLPLLFTLFPPSSLWSIPSSYPLFPFTNLTLGFQIVWGNRTGGVVIVIYLGSSSANESDKFFAFSFLLFPSASNDWTEIRKRPFR